MRYTITVTTAAHKSTGESRPMWQDTMEWRRVDAATVDWFAGSCKAAVGWYATRPAVVSGEHYTVTYSTIIVGEDGREHPGTVRGAELCNLSYSDLCGFQRFALAQLGELIEHFESRHGRDDAPRLFRSPLLAKLRLLWGVMRAWQTTRQAIRRGLTQHRA